jgi:hypothetical protein
MRFLHTSSLFVVALATACAAATPEPAIRVVDVFESEGARIESSAAIASIASISALQGGSTLAATIGSDGVVTIPLLQHGMPYVLAVENVPSATLPDERGAVSFYAVDGVRPVRIGDIHYARESPLETTVPTTMHLDAALAEPFETTDGIILISAAAATYQSHYADESPAAPGDTTLDWAIDVSSGSNLGTANLPDTREGDDVYLLHLRSAVEIFPGRDDAWGLGGAYLQQIVGVLTPESFVPTDGGSIEVMGAFTAPSARSLAIDFRVTEFGALLADFDVDPSESLEIYREPGTGPGVVVGIAQPLVSLTVGSTTPPDDPDCYMELVDTGMCAATCPADCGAGETMVVPTDFAGTIEYADVYTFPGTEVMYASTTGVVVQQSSATATRDTAVATVSVGIPLADYAGGPIQPRLGMVGAPAIDGSPLVIGEVAMGVASGPTISWSPPTVGTADWYRVVLTDLEDRGAIRRLVVATAYTTETSFTFPAGTLVAGHTYFARIDANHDGRHVERLGEVPSFHNDFSARPTGMFAP